MVQIIYFCKKHFFGLISVLAFFLGFLFGLSSIDYKTRKRHIVVKDELEEFFVNYNACILRISLEKIVHK